MYGSATASSSYGITPLSARIARSAILSAAERRLAPIGSSRYSTRSCRTSARHRNLRGIEVRKTLSNRPRPRDHARDSGADVVCTLEAGDLQGHARHHRALQRRGAIVIRNGTRERGQEAGGSRAEAHAHDVHVHRLAGSLVAHSVDVRKREFNAPPRGRPLHQAWESRSRQPGRPRSGTSAHEPDKVEARSAPTRGLPTRDTRAPRES